MENCLVKTLKGEVNNNNLPVLGELVLKVNEFDGTPINLQSKVTLRTNDTITVTVDGNGYFAVTLEGLDNPSSRLTSKVIESSDGSVVLYFKNDTYNIHISNKYSISNIVIQSNSNDNIALASFDMEDIKYLQELSKLYLSYTNCSGNVSSISKIGLEQLNLQASDNIEGTLAELGLISTLSELTLFRTKKIKGNWNDFVASQVTKGRTSEQNGISGRGMMFIPLGTTYSLTNELGVLTWESASKIACYTGGSTISNCTKVYVYGYGTQEQAEALFPGKTVIKCD